MGVPRFLLQLFRESPNLAHLLRSLALGSKAGDRTVTSADGTTLAARCTGDGAPVVLVHGTLDGIGAFSLVELRLAERYAVWVYDRRGRGGSEEGATHSLAHEVDDLRAVAAATGAAPHVVAHSYGAVVALLAAASGVEMRSLALYEPPINGEALSEEQVAEIARAVEDGHPDRAIELMAQRLAGVTDEELALARSVPPVRTRLRDAVRTAPRELEALRAVDWSSAGLPLRDVPVLLLEGQRRGSDAYPRPEQIADLAVDVERVVLDGQGHLAHTFAPAAFAAAIRGFLDQH